MKLTDVEKGLQAQQEAIHKIKEELQAAISALPDNPSIKRLGHGAFTISSKDLGNNWTPEFHDFKIQYGILITLIDKTQPDKLANVLTEVINNGKLRDKDRNRTVYFHPEVIKLLKELFL